MDIEPSVQKDDLPIVHVPTNPNIIREKVVKHQGTKRTLKVCQLSR